MPYSSATIGGHLIISPPLINSSSPWASSRAHLDALYDSPHTGAVTTRTSTITGFSEDNAIHTVAFHVSTVSSINSYGYSPIKLDTYLEWIREIVVAHPASEKPFIVSIASALPDEMRTMFATIQSLRASLAENGNKTVIAVEVNTSCPNIKDHPPPGYNLVELGELLHVIHDVVLADTANPVPLVIGIKLPPYVHSGQFAEVVDLLATLHHVAGRNPVSFLTCTNTLGSSLLFDHQVVPSSGEGTRQDSGFALPTVFGGLAGEAIHALSLGCACLLSILSRSLKFNDMLAQECTRL